MVFFLKNENGSYLLLEDGGKIILQEGTTLYSRADEVTLPLTTDDLETMYTSNDEINVAEDDDIYVDQTGMLQYMLHQFKVRVEAQTKCSIEWQGKSNLSPTLSTVYLQIYNHVTFLWETIDSNNSADESIDFELEGDIKDLTNYKDISNVIACRVYQLAI